ncbi:MAG: oligopeptide:H+ symporter [Gammaproteobacteria bacterium]|nr:oligopeptide:H+ symporter [Gammaproteobacteria bacterium]
MQSRHPTSLWVLAFANLSDCFSYYGTITILVLYAMHVFQMDRNQSYIIYGFYAALIYSTPVLGGIIADRWLGSRKTLILGGILAIVGNLILLSQCRYGFSLGLSTSVIGSGFYKSNSTHMIGMLYPDNDPKKESAFTWLYVFCNIGGTLSPLVYGFLIYKAGWSDGFLCSAIVILLSLLWLLSTKSLKSQFATERTGSTFETSLIYALSLVGCGLFSLPFFWPVFIAPVMIGFFIIVIGYLLMMLSKYKGLERARLAVLLALSLFGMLYYATVMQVGTTIVLFIQQKINLGAINTHLPASVFGTFYALFVIVLAPIFSMLWKALKARGIILSAPIRLALGILIAGLGIMGFAVASLTSYVLFGILMGNLLLSAGDLILMPAIYTAISNNAPQGIKNSLIGSWFLFLALGGYLSSLLARVSNDFSTKFMAHTPAYAGEFIFIAGFTALIAIALMIISPKFSKVLL